MTLALSRHTMQCMMSAHLQREWERKEEKGESMRSDKPLEGYRGNALVKYDCVLDHWT